MTLHPLTAPTLHTERLVLRHCTPDDFAPFAALYASERSAYIDGPLPRAAAHTLFAASAGRWALLGYGAWAIEHRDTGQSAGLASINPPTSLPERELGWILWEGFEGHGYALEAATRIRDFAFQELNATGLVSYIDRRNEKSITLASQLGAVLDEEESPQPDGVTLVYRHAPAASTGKPQEPPMTLIVISGPVGVGKTSTAQELSHRLEARGVPHTFVDLDGLAASFPRPDDDPYGTDLALTNLRSIWANAQVRGSRNLIIARTIETQTGLDAISTAIPGSAPLLYQLDACADALLVRVRKRETGSGREWHEARALSLMDSLRTAGLADMLINTDGRSIRTIAEEIDRQTAWS